MKKWEVRYAMNHHLGNGKTWNVSLTPLNSYHLKFGLNWLSEKTLTTRSNFVSATISCCVVWVGWILCALIRWGAGVGILGFAGFGGCQKFLISRGLPYGGIFPRGRLVYFPSVFPFWNARFPKLNFLPQAPSFSIFTFSDLRWMQDFSRRHWL